MTRLLKCIAGSNAASPMDHHHNESPGRTARPLKGRRLRNHKWENGSPTGVAVCVRCRLESKPKPEPRACLTSPSHGLYRMAGGDWYESKTVPLCYEGLEEF